MKGGRKIKEKVNYHIGANENGNKGSEGEAVKKVNICLWNIMLEITF